MIIAAPDVPSDKVVQTHVTHVDLFPTALECLGAVNEDENLPGYSLWKIANTSDFDRIAFSEYHAL